MACVNKFPSVFLSFHLIDFCHFYLALRLQYAFADEVSCNTKSRDLWAEERCLLHYVHRWLLR
jgi:hypothetical protein